MVKRPERGYIKYNQDIENELLDLWWTINPGMYNEYWHKGVDGSEMLYWLAVNNFEFYYRLYRMVSTR